MGGTLDGDLTELHTDFILQVVARLDVTPIEVPIVEIDAQAAAIIAKQILGLKLARRTESPPDLLPDFRTQVSKIS
jgi:hypothetical protein